LSEPAVRVHVRPWPDLDGVQTLVLLDHHTAPDDDQVGTWIEQVRADHPGTTAIRTSALHPPAAAVFARHGFHVADDLALLERSLDRPPLRRDGPAPPATPERAAELARRDVRADRRERRVGIRRMRRSDLETAARIDRSAFPSGWSNDTAALAEIRRATPQQRSRVAVVDGAVGGFAITGRAGVTGYLQRLAVDPGHRRRGLARRLVDDALDWLARRGAVTVLVNTGVDNGAALDLYRSVGFRRRPDGLAVMERRFDP
jgi:ribosomal-protein-alanine N-acetyltransferase